MNYLQPRNRFSDTGYSKARHESLSTSRSCEFTPEAASFLPTDTDSFRLFWRDDLLSSDSESRQLHADWLFDEATSTDRAAMTNEDYRAHEMRRCEVKSQFCPAVAPAFTIECTLSDVYKLHNQLAQVISCVEEEGSDQFDLAIGQTAFTLRVMASGIEFAPKSLLTAGLVAEQLPLECMQAIEKEVWAGLADWSLPPLEETSFKVQYEAGTQVEALLDWQSADLALSKHQCSQQLADLEKHRRIVNNQDSLIKARNIQLTKECEAVALERRRLRREKDRLDTAKKMHHDQVCVFKLKLQESMESLQKVSSCQLASHEDPSAGLDSLQQEIQDLEQRIAQAPEHEHAHLRLQLSRLQTRHASCRAARVLSQQFGSPAFRSLQRVQSSRVTRERPSILGELSPMKADSSDVTTLSKEVTIIKASLEDKLQDLQQRERELQKRWLETFVVDDIVPSIHAHTQELERVECELMKDQERLDKQRLKLAERLTACQKKERELESHEKLLQQRTSQLYTALQTIAAEVY